MYSRCGPLGVDLDTIWLRDLKISVMPSPRRLTKRKVEENKRVNLIIGEKYEINKKLESGVSVVRVCHEKEMRKQTVSDIRPSNDELTSYAMTLYVAPSKDREGAVHKRKHMKAKKSRVGESGL